MHSYAVCALVFGEVVGGGEGLATEAAFIGSLARVDAAVNGQVTRRGETFPTVRARKWLLPRVRSQVQHQAVVRRERFAATCRRASKLVAGVEHITVIPRLLLLM